MGKKILVMGGSYFAGRVFAILSARETDFELTLVNRGRYSMSFLPNVTEYICDRRDETRLRSLPLGRYDAVVDFCAYNDEDVRILLDSLSEKPGRYIFLSTADVYQRTGLDARDEHTPLLTEPPAGEVGEYLFGKVLAERKAAELCAGKGISLTVLRPTFIYGPYNYAPRENIYIEKIVRGQPLPLPTDADSHFQCVYVKDVALAIIACVNSTPDAACGAYNLAAPEVLDYSSFLDVLRSVSDLPSQVQTVTVEQAMQAGIPLPFPLTPEEAECFDGNKFCRELGFCYTPFRDGLQKTYQSTKPVYQA